MSKPLSYPYGWQPPFRPDPVSQHSGGDADNALYLKKFFWARTIEGIWRSGEPFLSKRNSGRYLYQIAEGSKKAIERKAEPEKNKTCFLVIRASEVASEAMPLLQPENVCKISGKLLVESVVAPVGGRVPEDYSPNLVSFRDTMKPEPIELFFLVDYAPNKSSCILEDYQTLFFCGLNSGLCHLGGSKNLGPRNWRFSSNIHVFTLPTKKKRRVIFLVGFLSPFLWTP